MPTVIRNHNDPHHARSLNGTWVRREPEIYLPSHERSYPCLNTSMHFCYRESDVGGVVRNSSTMLCTCGAPAVVFDFPAYRKYTSVNLGEAIACLHLIQYGVHADGSHE